MAPVQLSCNGWGVISVNDKSLALLSQSQLTTHANCGLIPPFMKSGGRGERCIRAISERYQRRKPREADQKRSHGTNKHCGVKASYIGNPFFSASVVYLHSRIIRSPWFTYMTASSGLRGLRQNAVQSIVTPISLQRSPQKKSALNLNTPA